MMRRLSFLCLLALAIGSTGCIAASVNEHAVGDTSQTAVVAVEKQVYVVNKQTGKVWKVDLSEATTLRPGECSEE